MKYKVLVNASLPEIRLALSREQILDDEKDPRLSVKIIDKCIKDKWIEPMGKKMRKPVENKAD